MKANIWIYISYIAFLNTETCYVVLLDYCQSQK